MRLRPHKGQRDGLLGVALRPDGIALAHALQPKGEPPRLAFHHFEPCQPHDHAETLARLLKDHRLERVPCNHVLEPGTYHLLQVEAPDVEPAELKSALRWRIKDLIDFHVDDAVIDVFDLPGQDQPGRARMMYVVAAKTSTIQARVDLLREAGAALATIDVSELALRNVTAQLPEDAGGLALLALKADGGLIVLTRAGELYLARHLDIGTAAIADALGNITADGTAAPGESMPMENIVLEVQRSLDYYEGYFGQGPIGALAVGPTVTDISGLVPYLGEQLGLPTHLLDLGAAVEADDPPAPETQARCLEAIGAALRKEHKSL